MYDFETKEDIENIKIIITIQFKVELKVETLSHIEVMKVNFTKQRTISKKH